MNQNPFLNDSTTLISLENNSLLIGYGPFESFSLLSLTDPTRPAFYMPDFFLDSPLPWLQHEQWLELSLDAAQQLLANQNTSFKSDLLEWKVECEDVFEHSFVKLQHFFKEGKLNKAVPYLFCTTQSHMDTIQKQRSLLAAINFVQGGLGTVYGHWDQESGFLGISPETLFEHKETDRHRLKTMALAGTKSHKELDEELYLNAKECHEHAMVVQGISQALSALGQVHIGIKSVVHLPTLKHLMTPIEVGLKGKFDFDQTVRLLHPTPALGAFPIKEGWKWLREYEIKIPRKNYGAPFGCSYPQKLLSLCLVAIRQVQWNQQGMRIGAGCGVVPQSLLNQEKSEISLKLNAIKNQLDL